jgi:translation initiation factor IF-1
MAGDTIEVVGTVVRQAHDLYDVEASFGGSKRRVLAKRSGRMDQHRIRIIVGDTVTVEVSPYDVGRGRIVYRGIRGDAS